MVQLGREGQRDKASRFDEEDTMQWEQDVKAPRTGW